LATKLRVGVIFGGRSGEHEISVRSATAVIQAIDHGKYEVVPIAITKEGKWLAPPAAAQLLPNGARSFLGAGIVNGSDTDIAILGDPSHQGLTSLQSEGHDLSTAKTRCRLSSPPRSVWRRWNAARAS
jgi:D-alanine-D-alanine ligase